VRRIVAAGLAAVVIAGGTATAVWRADAGGSSGSGRAGSVDSNFPVGNQISCASATSCLAVGSAIRGTPGTSAPVAQAFDAGTWRTVTVKSPGPPERPSTLTGVSCPAASYCLAVGEYDPGARGIPLPYAVAWNGTSLSPVARLPLPTSTYLDEIGGVSCPAVNNCVVLGHAHADGPTAAFTDGELVWTWNGNTWSMTAVPTPDTVDMEDLSSIQCTTATDCVAAGDVAILDDTVPALDTWNGRSFTPLSPPAPTGMTYAGFSGLSCVSRNRCAVVGLGYASQGSPITSFLDVWNGRTWTLTTWRGPKGAGEAELSAVSCASVSDCLAVGSDGPDTDLHAAALTWNGTRWAAAAVPSPGPGRMSVFDGVNCSKAGGCAAIGEEAKAGVTLLDLTDAVPLAGLWSGSAWQVTAP
jgi:hypothetical protein